MEMKVYDVDIKAEKLNFEDFCSKLNFFIPDDFREHLSKITLNVPFIVDDTLLSWLGYSGDFHKKNMHFKQLLIDTNKENEENKVKIPHDIIKLQSANIVKISFTHFIQAVMKMRTSKAIEIRTFLSQFVIVQWQYHQYLLKKFEFEQQVKIENFKKNNEISHMKQKIAIIEKNHEIELLRREKNRIKKIKKWK
jgi:hypothetical protein